MKIRTDFVTNSSSYSTAEVVIDNPLLLKILKKYKKMGTFDTDYSDFAIGDYELYEGVDHRPYMETTLKPALFVDEIDSFSWSIAPSSLEMVVDCLIECFEGGDAIADQELFEELQSELEDKSDEIKAAYKFVIWKYSDESNDRMTEYYKGYMLDENSFYFDPINGEEFRYSLKAGPGIDTKVKEGFTFAEKHILNGEVKLDINLLSDHQAEVEKSDDDNDDSDDADNE